MKSKLNSISVRIKRKIKENKHVEKGFRKLKSYLDLYSPVEFQSFDSIHPVSLDSLIYMMKGGYKKNKELILSKSKDVFIDASEVEKVSCLVEQYKKLYLKDVNIDGLNENCVTVIGRRYYKRKVGGLKKDILAIAASENPNSKVYYIPSQSELVNNKSVIENLPNNVITLSHNINPDSFILRSDKVYTYGSVYGFDALIFGKQIIVFGNPFYSSCEGASLRYGKKEKTDTLESVFYTYFIRDVNYKSPISKLPIEFNEALVWLFVSKGEEFHGFFSEVYSSKTTRREFSYGPSVSNDKDYLLEIIAESTSISSNLLKKLLNSQPPSASDTNELITYDISRLDIYYNGVENYFRKLVEYDKLQTFIDEFTDELSSYITFLPKKVRVNLIDSLSNSIKTSRGRKPQSLLEIPTFMFDFGSTNKKLWFGVLRYYLLRFEYSHVRTMIDSCKSHEERIWFRIASILHETEGNNAFRVDTNWFMRQELLEEVSNKFFSIIKTNESYSDDFTKVLYYYMIKDSDEFNHWFSDYLNNHSNEMGANEAYYFKSMINHLMKLGGYKKAECFLDRHKNYLSELSLEGVYINSLVNSGKLDKALLFIESDDLFNVDNILSKKSHFSLCYAIVNYYRQCGKFDNAYSFLVEYKNYLLFSDKKHSEPSLKKIQLNIEANKFLHDSKVFVNAPERITDTSKIKGVIFQAHCVDHYHALAMSTPIIHQLKTMGYVVVSLSQEVKICEPTGIPIIDKYIGYLISGCSDGCIQLDWNLDWANKKVECEGVNFYQGIYEQLSIRYRSFDIDINKPGIKRFLDTTLKQCDLALRLCLELEKDKNLKGFPLLFLGATSHRAPASIFRDFALNRGDNIFYSSYNIGYEKYYKGQSTRLSSMLTVLDMTQHPECRAGFLALPSRFRKWIADANNLLIAQEKVHELLEMQRGSLNSSQDYNSYSVIEQAKTDGKKIICCFGKMTCDLAVPQDGGNAHSDMKDWINHTIEIVKGNDDFLLLIKPHPVELVSESSLDLQQYFRDLIPKELPSNVIFLGHNEFRVPEIAPHIDLAILYNGTSSMELTILGVPVMMTSYYGKYDYPIDLIYPRNRRQYEEYILSGSYEIPSESLKQDAAGLLYYMGTSDVSIENKITNRSSTNDNIGTPSYNTIEMERYLSHGDEQIKLAALRAVESSIKFLER